MWISGAASRPYLCAVLSILSKLKKDWEDSREADLELTGKEPLLIQRARFQQVTELGFQGEDHDWTLGLGPSLGREDGVDIDFRAPWWILRTSAAVYMSVERVLVSELFSPTSTRTQKLLPNISEKV